MKKLYLTMVPGKRISCKCRPEMRVAAPISGKIRVLAEKNDEVHSLGEYEIKGRYALNRIYLDVSMLSGEYIIRVSFSGGALDLLAEERYTIIDSETNSGQLIDGCWVSLYHWSEEEARHFNGELATLTDIDWKHKIYDMHALGITSVLIQNVFYSNEYVNQHSMTMSTYMGAALYPSGLWGKRYPIAASDSVEAILSAADQCGMTVFPGIGMYAWFDFSTESLKWHIMVTKELFNRYGHHKSFYGWYISEEIMGALYHGYPYVPDEKHRDIQNFFREYTAFVRMLTPTKPVALAPNNIDFHLYEREWLPILENIDIIIPFAFARFPEKENIKEIAAICQKTDTHFWVDMEMFRFPLDNGLVPKSFDELIKEIRSYDMLEQIYGYQYTGIMNAPGFVPRMGREDTVDLYLEYKQYAKERLGNLL